MYYDYAYDSKVNHVYTPMEQHCMENHLIHSGTVGKLFTKTTTDGSSGVTIKPYCMLLLIDVAESNCQANNCDRNSVANMDELKQQTLKLSKIHGEILIRVTGKSAGVLKAPWSQHKGRGFNIRGRGFNVRSLVLLFS